MVPQTSLLGDGVELALFLLEERRTSSGSPGFTQLSPDSLKVDFPFSVKY